MSATMPPYPIGVIPPPPGVTPNFEHPIRRGYEIVPMCIIGIPITTAFLVMRLYTKARINKFFGWDDICLVIAYVFAMATLILAAYTFQRDHGTNHLWEVTIQRWMTGQKLITAMTAMYPLALAFAKMSLLLTLRRIAPKGRIHIAIYVAMAIVISYSIALIIPQIFSCRPLARTWDPMIPGTCINEAAAYICLAAFNIVTDLGILLIPIPMVMGLRLPLKQRIGITVMFGVGSLTFVTSICRLALLPRMLFSEDFTWEVVAPTIWLIIEANLMIICCTLFSLRAFLRAHWPSLIGEKNSGSGTAPKIKKTISGPISGTNISRVKAASLVEGSYDDDKDFLVTEKRGEYVQMVSLDEGRPRRGEV